MESGTTTGISTVLSAVVSDIWDLVGSFITFANTNTIVWVRKCNK